MTTDKAQQLLELVSLLPLLVGGAVADGAAVVAAVVAADSVILYDRDILVSFVYPHSETASADSSMLKVTTCGSLPAFKPFGKE